MKREAFVDRVVFRAPPTFTARLELAAEQAGATPSSYAREAIIARMRADGVWPAPAPQAEAA